MREIPGRWPSGHPHRMGIMLLCFMAVMILAPPFAVTIKNNIESQKRLDELKQELEDQLSELQQEGDYGQPF